MCRDWVASASERPDAGVSTGALDSMPGAVGSVVSRLQLVTVRPAIMKNGRRARRILKPQQQG
ncbi:MAG TPA: hypothetical protein VD930_10770 [Gemmatimonadales bacterium]|nr:hypothetical protein [Gemmatimonadales bacterium]